MVPKYGLRSFDMGFGLSGMRGHSDACAQGDTEGAEAMVGTESHGQRGTVIVPGKLYSLSVEGIDVMHVLQAEPYSRGCA